MEGILLLLRSFVLLKNKRFRPTERVVNFANVLGVGEGYSPILAWQSLRKLVETLQRLFDLNGAVQHDCQYGLSCTGVVYDLPSEEQVFVFVCEAGSGLRILGPLEQKDEAVDRVQSLQQGLVIETVDLLNLNVRDAQPGDEFAEDARV